MQIFQKRYKNQIYVKTCKSFPNREEVVYCVTYAIAQQNRDEFVYSISVDKPILGGHEDRNTKDNTASLLRPHM